MPVEKEEAREEDGLKIESKWERILKLSQLPSKEALLANTVFSAALATPVAELAVINIAWMQAINHQLDKAELYIE